MWWGARNGRVATRPPVARPAAPCTFVISIASAVVGGGRIPGSRRASIVLPAPGGPTIRRLWPPAAAISSARRASAWPRTSARSRPASGGAHRAPGLAPARAPSGRRAARRAGSAWARRRRPGDRRAPPPARSPPGPPGAACPLRRAAIAIARAPLTGRISPDSESSPHTASAISTLRQLSAGRQHGHRDREVEARTRLRHRRRREVRGYPLLRELEARVEERRPHTLARLADRAVGKPDDCEGGQPAANVDLGHDVHGIDPIERERLDPGEHWG